MMKRAALALVHAFFGNRRTNNEHLRELAIRSRGKVILELGSGKMVDGKFSYSAAPLFPDAEEFIMTDVNPAFGHRIVDATTMVDKDKYDVILCLSVLEHIYDYQKAIDNLHAALREDGQCVIFTPFCYPLHDEPGDYWRFTEHALRRMLSAFRRLQITPRKHRKIPTGYFVVATK
jgi:SAM-dependent methyltransferase